MTIEELKKIRYNCKTNSNCCDCPYGYKDIDCLYSFQDDAIEIIEWQEKEIERLKVAHK